MHNAEYIYIVIIDFILTIILITCVDRHRVRSTGVNDILVQTARQRPPPPPSPPLFVKENETLLNWPTSVHVNCTCLKEDSRVDQANIDSKFEWCTRKVGWMKHGNRVLFIYTFSFILCAVEVLYPFLVRSLTPSGKYPFSKSEVV